MQGVWTTVNGNTTPPLKNLPRKDHFLPTISRSCVFGIASGYARLANLARVACSNAKANPSNSNSEYAVPKNVMPKGIPGAHRTGRVFEPLLCLMETVSG